MTDDLSDLRQERLEREKRAIQDYLVVLRAEWESTRNPLYVWEAIRFVGQYETPPAWVMDYLMNVADVAFHATNEQPELSSDSATKLIEEAIGLRRPPKYNAVQVMRKDGSAQSRRELFLEEAALGTPSHKVAGQLAKKLNRTPAQVRNLRRKYDLDEAALREASNNGPRKRKSTRGVNFR